MTDPLAAVVAQRQQEYGQFINNACTAQRIKSALRDCPGWNELRQDARESLDMMASKMARIVSGGKHEHADSWLDLGGYSRLVLDRIEKGL